MIIDARLFSCFFVRFAFYFLSFFLVLNERRFHRSRAFSRIRAKWIIFFSRRASHSLPFRTLFRLAVTRDARARALSALCAGDANRRQVYTVD